MLRACDLATNLSENAALPLPDAVTAANAAGATRWMLRSCDLVTNLSEDAADHLLCDLVAVAKRMLKMLLLALHDRCYVRATS